MLLKSFGDNQMADPQNQTQKLEEFLSRLEEERVKIDAFKRELPLCMTLLTNAMEASRQQLQSYHQNQTPRPVLEQFIPLNNSISQGSDKITTLSDKANWMTSAQLWSQTSEGTNKKNEMMTSSKESEVSLTVSPKLGLDHNYKQRNGGAFMQFSREQGLCSDRVIPDLALANCVDTDLEDNKCLERDMKPNMEHKQGETVATNTQMAIVNVPNNITSSQAQRKARRCWSPDLHRRFVNALQMLGGSQVATPKQIRELMKVDGLTNDEVKSHLQKYRLHTRRPSPTPQSAGGPPPQLVVLGGIWVPPEYAAAAAAHGGAPPPSLYGAHPPPPHYFHTPPQTAALAAAHHHQQQMQLQMYNPSLGAAAAERSPESEVRGSGSVEDGKTESGSEIGERKGLAALRAEGEESNGSGITLKF